MDVVQTITQQQLVQMEKVVLTRVSDIPMDVVRTTELQLMDLNMMVVHRETLNQVGCFYIFNSFELACCQSVSV